ncbi:MAG: hypothetical protein K0R19_2027 [Bacillota bacterium]|nr:hypothetical protein [Bacillota bacterium]
MRLLILHIKSMDDHEEIKKPFSFSCIWVSSMNEKECIVFLRGIDRTAEIKSITNLGTSYRVVFYHTEDTASYHPSEVNAETVVSYAEQCESILVMVEGRILDATRIYQSQNYCKIIEGETRSLFPLRQVKMSPCKQKIKNLKAKLIYLADFPVGEVEAVYDFGEHYRIVHKDGTRILCPAALVHIDVKRPLTDEMNYLGQIAALQDDGRTGSPANILRRQFEHLRYINSDSVLNSYLKQVAPVQEKGSQSFIYPFSFNLSQKHAIEKVFENKISIIESPPGTGKEETILNILVNAVMQNKTVAVLSNSDAGLRNLQDRLHEENASFLTAVLGSDSFFFNQTGYPAEISEWKRSESERKKLSAEIHQNRKEMIKLLEVQREKAVLLQELADLLKEKEYFDHYLEKNHLEEWKDSFFSHSQLSSEQLVAFLADNTMQLSKGRVLGLFSKIKFFFKYGFTNFEALEENNFEVMLHFQRKFYEVKIELFKKNVMRLEKKLLSKDFSRKALAVSEKSKAILQAELYERFQERLDIRLAFDKATYDQEFYAFVKEYPIVFCSPDALRGSIAQDFLYDYIIIDDASQVNLAAATLALSCCRNAVLVGDARQAPLIADAKYRAENEQLFHEYSISDEYNYNRHSILSSMDKLFRRTIARTILREHNRCQPQIIEFCNRKYYNEELIAVSEENPEIQPLLLLSTISAKHVRMIPREDDEDHQQRAMETITEDLLIRGSLTQDHADLIGYETPYRKRSNKSGLSDSFYEGDLALKYQEKEKDIIIYSAVLDLPKQVGDQNWTLIDDPRQVNVAVSRAKHQLVVVTTESFVKTQGSNIGDLIRYTEYQTGAESLLNHDLIPVFDIVYREYTGYLISMKSKMKYSARNRAAFLMNNIIEMILRNIPFRSFFCAHGVPLRVLINNWEMLTEEESVYAQNPLTSVDFVIYNRFDKLPVLAIEVGGMAYHGKKAIHLIRDDMKERILEKYKIDLLWISINEGWEGDILRNKLEEILSGSSEHIDQAGSNPVGLQ